MKTLLALALLFTASASQAYVCDYVVYNHNANELYSGHHEDVLMKQPKAISEVDVEYTLNEVRTSPDTYIETLSVNSTASTPTELKCEESNVVEHHHVVALITSCKMEYNVLLEVTCKLY